MLSSVLGPLMAASLLFVSQAQAAGPIAQVIDANNFCTFLPPSDSTDRVISDTEWNAVPFCMGNTPAAIGAGKIPDGFIQSAHFVATDDYVQVTGQIDPSKANLLTTDWGGQYDIKAPNPSECAGYNYYVNLIEPASFTYCIRCCNNVANCNRGISEKGCAHIIPGDYSGPISDAQIQAGQEAADAATASSSSPAAPAASSPGSSSSSSGGSTPAAPSQGSGKTASTPSNGSSDASSADKAASPSAGASSSGTTSSSSVVSSPASSSKVNTSPSASSNPKSSDGSMTAQSVEDSAAMTERPALALLITLSMAALGGISLY